MIDYEMTEYDRIWIEMRDEGIRRAGEIDASGMTTEERQIKTRELASEMMKEFRQRRREAFRRDFIRNVCPPGEVQ